MAPCAIVWWCGIRRPGYTIDVRVYGHSLEL